MVKKGNTLAAPDKNGLPGARRLFRLRGHEAGVNEMAWSPDGETLASASDDAHIRLWSASTGEPVRKLEGGGGAVISVDWSPDGALLAAGFRGGSIRLWRAEDHAPCCMAAGKNVVNRVRWSPDGGLLASASADSNICLWRVEDDGLTLVRTLSGHKDAVMGLAWSPDGHTLASGSMDQTILLWRVPEREPFQTLTGHGDAVTCLAWSPDGELLVSGSDDATIRILHPETGRQDQSLEDHTGFVREVRFSADGALLVSKSWDGTARLWRSDGWKPLGRVASGYNLLGGAAFHPQKPVLALLGESNNRIDIWEMSGERLPGVSPAGHGRMLLKSLWLTDVRCFENVHFPFETEDGATRGWTLLLGENGCGKTTILRAAALLTAGREGFADLIGDPEDWIRSGRDQCKLQAELFDAGGEPFMVELVIARGLTPQQLLDKNRAALESVDKAMGGLKNPYPTYGYGCSRRLSRQPPGPANEPRAFRSWP
ncbi:MAG: AAA family ATPase, partial [Desulfobacterales bacterium]|nr:AAA family ATPase [Desulfobacterales bacterium]